MLRTGITKPIQLNHIGCSHLVTLPVFAYPELATGEAKYNLTNFDDTNGQGWPALGCAACSSDQSTTDHTYS